MQHELIIRHSGMQRKGDTADETILRRKIERRKVIPVAKGAPIPSSDCGAVVADDTVVW